MGREGKGNIPIMLPKDFVPIPEMEPMEKGKKSKIQGDFTINNQREWSRGTGKISNN
jgi:hypothetical protein